MRLFVPPLLDAPPCICHRQEPAGIEAFGANAAVKGLDVGVIRHGGCRCLIPPDRKGGYAGVIRAMGHREHEECGQAVALT